MSILHDLIVSEMSGGSGGGSITVDTELSESSTNPVQNKAVYAAFAYAADQLDEKELAPIVENVSGTTASIEAEDHYYYKCGELTALTVTSSPSSGSWSVRFTSGSTATVLTMPNEVKMPDGFEVEASTVYEINVLDNYALVASWPVGVST